MFFPLKGMGRQELIEKKPFFQIASSKNVFLTVIWLLHSQLWAIIDGAASLTLYLTLCFYILDLKVTGNLVKRLGP